MAELLEWVRVYDEVLSEPICARWRSAIDSKGERINTDYLRCDKMGLEHHPWAETKAIFADVFDHYRGDVAHNGNLNFCTHIEIPAVLKYQVGRNDFFHLHADNWSYESALRQVSIVAFLNTVREGGDTVFPNIDSIRSGRGRPGTTMPRDTPRDFRVPAVVGRVVVFPAFFLYPHKAEAPVIDDKYVMVSWYCYPPASNNHYAVVPLK